MHKPKLTCITNTNVLIQSAFRKSAADAVTITKTLENTLSRQKKKIKWLRIL